jgi:colanic acid/amylovoran biosynthesis glycosyltransferase
VRGRVVLVVPAFPRLSETFIVSKFLGLLERGWDVHVVCNRSAEKNWGLFPQLAPIPSARRRVHVTWPAEPSWKASLLLPLAVLRCVQSRPVRTLRYVWRGLKHFGVFGTVGRLYLDADLVRLSPDILHFEFGALAPNRMYLRELLGCKVIASFRGYDLNYVGLDRPNHYAPVWSRAAGLHFLGEDLWRRARRRGFPEDCSHVLIPPAIDTEFFAPRSEAPAPREGNRPLRILSVGRLEWKKGYEDALLAVRKLLDRGMPVEYRIVGGGDYLGALGFARYRLGLERCVEFLGAVPRADVLAEMERADIFLHAAVSEGFCNAVLEAQSMELPVVCSDADGLPENVADGETGFVVPRRDPSAMAVKMEVLARDPALARRMGRAGRRRVQDRFRLADQLDRWEEFYGDVLAREASNPLASEHEAAHAEESRSSKAAIPVAVGNGEDGG